MTRAMDKMMFLEEDVLGLGMSRSRKTAMSQIRREVKKNNFDRAVKMVTKLFDGYEVEETYCIKHEETFRAIDYRMTILGKGGEIGFLLRITKIEPLTSR